ncbi:hypothetical protein D929_02198 [Enterococcus faecalis 02-MB-P-10]|uniref:hypothetical protein n=1 Tax=Enterococcus faecalis TaxID=1351 RepID=UPI000353A3BC|nr:hypothetical protein [Enterococcus faecalis]EPH71484.1 hypothetical protein D929_02198 [Enterococcus faecalis 02-MB-P-10]
MKYKNLSLVVLGYEGDVWKADVKKDEVVIVDPKGFMTEKVLEGKGYKVKSVSLEEPSCNYYRKTVLTDRAKKGDNQKDELDF